MNTLNKVVCCGLSTLDLTYYVERPPKTNEKIVAQEYAIDIGGPALNAARTIRVLGGNVVLVTALGNRQIGQLIRNDLGDMPVTDIAPEEYVAPVSTVLVDRTGARAVTSVNATKIESISTTSLPKLATALLVDGHLIDAQIDLATQAKRIGIPVIFDGGSWKPGTEQLISSVSVAALSADFEIPDKSDPLAWCRENGVATVIQTHGENPVEVWTKNDRFKLPVPNVRVVDTLGAGDIFHGALALALSQKANIRDAIQGAIVLASESVTHSGALGWVN